MPDTAPAATPWSVAKHDTIPQVDLWLNPLETHTYLFAFLSADGEKFEPPYEAVRTRVEEIIEQVKSHERQGQSPSRDVKDQRIRTWKSIFESFGFLHTDSVQNSIRLSPLGRTVRFLYEEVNRRIEGANDHLATLGIAVLNRHLLYNPLDGELYPQDSDLRPFRLMWRSMRELDDKLHWEEMNRVIMWVNYRHQIDAAIKHIREVRKQCNGIYDGKSLALLGNPAVSEGAETKRRITPWFTRAGFGGMLISGTDDEHGYRQLVLKYRHLIDGALKDESPVPVDALASKAAYLLYLADQAAIATSSENASDETEILRVVAAVERYGGSRIVCLSGIPGTGKSRLAKLAAAHLADYDPYRFEEIQFHETTSYEDFMEGFVPRPSGEGFELVRKTFRDINRRARLDPSGSRYVLLIEEFTRANVHAVLGELITYIEHRDRPFRLSLSQEEERIAPNLVVIATMNPRDKSALVLDDAISRRLYRIAVDSSDAQLKAMLDGKLEATALLQLAEWFKKYRSVLPFGHGAFADARSAADLKEIWNGSIRYFLLDVAGAVREPFRELEGEFPLALTGSHIRLIERGNASVMSESDWQSQRFDEASLVLKNLGVIGERYTGGFRIVEPRQFVGYYRSPSCSLRIDARRTELFEDLRGFVTRFPEKETAAETALAPDRAFHSLDPAVLFCSAFEAAVQAGLPFRYRRSVVASSHPRGRINFTQTFRAFQSRGIRHKVSCETSVREYDPSLTGVLATVSSLLMGDYSMPNNLLERLNIVSCLLEGSLIYRIPEAANEAAKLARRYEDWTEVKRLLALAQSILAQQDQVWDLQVPIAGGECRFCNMDRLWELAVHTAFQRTWSRAGRTVEYHPYRNRNVRLFPGGGPEIDPDCVAFDDGRPAIVVDAKYSDAQEPSASDVYQLLCYARRLDVPNAALVYISSLTTWHSVIGLAEGRIVIAAAGAATDNTVQGLLQIAARVCSAYDATKN